jgi:hypothetical protein
MWRNHLQRLARNNQVDVIQIYDPLDKALPPTGHYVVTDGQQRVNFFSGNPRVRENYAQQFIYRRDALQDMCRHPSMHYRALSTHSDTLAWDL